MARTPPTNRTELPVMVEIRVHLFILSSRMAVPSMTPRKTCVLARRSVNWVHEARHGSLLEQAQGLQPARDPSSSGTKLRIPVFRCHPPPSFAAAAPPQPSPESEKAVRDPHCSCEVLN
ncbi:unnamed protein product [Boreogadus saida]